MFRISLNELPKQSLSYPIPRSQAFSSGPQGAQEAARPDPDIYICLTKPQKSRKQNGITGFPTTIQKTPVPTAHL